MNSFLRYHFLIGLLLIPLQALHSQPKEHAHLDFGLTAGVTIPEGDLAMNAGNGYRLGFRGIISTDGPLRVDFNAHFNNLKIGQSDPYYPGSIFHGDLDYWMISAGVEFAPTDLPPFPYLGVDFMFNVLEETPVFYTETSHAGLGFGGGMSMPVTRRLGVDFRTQYQLLNLFDKGATGSSLSQVVAELSLLVSIF